MKFARCCPPGLELLSLADIGCHEELPETQDTLAGNARQKAEYVREHYGVDCFADDTGLEVAALGGAPGVYSARYAGPQRLAADNVAKLLRELAGHPDRSARFRTVVALAVGPMAARIRVCGRGSRPHHRGRAGHGAALATTPCSSPPRATAAPLPK